MRDNANERISSNSFCTPTRKTQQGAKWTEKESAKFLKALEVFGTDFSLIQALFPTRSPLQIKVLDPYIMKDQNLPKMLFMIYLSLFQIVAVSFFLIFPIFFQISWKQP